MQYIRLGKSGLSIFKVVLGCMGFGDPARGTHQWSLGIEESRPYFKQAIESGITAFDTANMYGLGSSEEITGRLLREFAKRDEVVIATKVYATMGPGPKGGGLSRAAILTQVDESLRRLDTDYIDLYQIHRLDPNVPAEETMEALHDVVKAGKARYIGASSMWTWQFANLQHTADLHGWTRFVSMQDQYNLLQREEEREMLPYCLDQGIGVIPWSPLARGRLTRDPDERTRRSSTDGAEEILYGPTAEADRGIVDAVAAIAAERGVSRAQVALAWVMHQPAVTAPIVGATRPHHLTDAVAATELVLGAEELTRLEEHYTPRPASGF
ncbi:aldo/keto reductase [Streptomyces yaizuensis]|uniref:Aldo/keto reductase n=1 Tax=Streptomyces yaizuensis TaxID=2989713 RepID=A0ABQ5NXU2_9ACTN|nr:aldo/keto reductase [Streptomyces sp. YSPA8]GLF95190.1 aldo/keto reductase [Streptomyces sp. YSPA8]